MSDRAEREAIQWRLQLPDMGEADWGAFTAWLEGNPDNRRAYDAVALLDDALPCLLRSPAVADSGIAQASSRDVPRQAGFGARIALVAGLVAAITVGLGYSFWPVAPADRIVTTAPGERRALTLADGTLVNLNGDSQIAIPSDARSIRLDRGEASFRVTHDDAKPFQVRVGTTLLQDVGTYFDVSRLPDGIEVAVADGSVAYDPRGANVVLSAGQAARVHGQPATLEIRTVDHASVGAWQALRLIYRADTVERIALDLTRSLGKRIQVDPSVASQTFTGILSVNGDSDDVRARIEGLLGIDIVVDGANWHFTPATSAPHR